MAEHADATQEKLSESDLAVTTDEGTAEAHPPDNPTVDEKADEAEDYDASVDDAAEPDAEGAVPAKKSSSPARLATVFGLVTAVGLTALAGWFGYQTYQSHQAQQQRELLVRIGRQGALNLTTIDWRHADADVQRILDSATGAFYDDFSHRSKPFIDVVKRAQSTSVGTITEAGLESQSGNEAQVLVAVSVKTSNLGAAEQDPRHWRMRVSVQKVGNEVKVSNVAFVP
ncbi:Mce protein [Mycobacterium parmense]|uniref:Mce associated membrane protein n=1 Tax=Mycobacterium parmense TaxID=185642 RepID=A0A7I7Z1B5_9MYCO|nr:Mce protein [Mycobacterium parmense]MCV7352319.1 Mce protein [Mycobacterium parmense]ORW56292.1 Mce protein [Mycobacterium parmense]BBZ47958.1 Mce associated membrane protein [Mycobacterium parmense]